MDSSDTPMHTDNFSEQMNGNVSKIDTETVVSFSPRPQRVLRLNRRGFFLSGHGDKTSPVQNLAINFKNLCKDSNHVQSAANGGHKLISPVSSEKKIIKLNSSTKYSPAESVNKLKRISQESDSNSADKIAQVMPPKKKHKEITWP